MLLLRTSASRRTGPSTTCAQPKSSESNEAERSASICHELYRLSATINNKLPLALRLRSSVSKPVQCPFGPWIEHPARSTHTVNLFFYCGLHASLCVNVGRSCFEFQLSGSYCSTTWARKRLNARWFGGFQGNNSPVSVAKHKGRNLPRTLGVAFMELIPLFGRFHVNQRFRWQSIPFCHAVAARFGRKGGSLRVTGGFERQYVSKWGGGLLGTPE